jgi:hypothetical protein
MTLHTTVPFDTIIVFIISFQLKWVLWSCGY